MLLDVRVAEPGRALGVNRRVAFTASPLYVKDHAWCCAMGSSSLGLLTKPPKTPPTDAATPAVVNHRIMATKEGAHECQGWWLE